MAKPFNIPKDEPSPKDKRKRKAHYYKLSEADHPVIIDGLKHFASLYHIALKIGCGYSTLKRYLKEHPDLVEVQRDAEAAAGEFVASQIMRKVASGYFPAMAFYAERKMGWTQHQTYENIGALPVIQFGIIAENDLPPPVDATEIQELERKYLSDGGSATENAPKTAQGGVSEVGDEDLPDDEADGAEGGFDGDFDDDDFPSGGMF